MDRVADNWDEAIRQQQLEQQKRQFLAQQQQQAIMLKQRQAQMSARRTQAMNVLGGRAAVIDAQQKQQQAVNDLKNDTLSALIVEARSNGGFVPPAVLGATSRTLGRVITGGGFQNGQLVLSSPADITDPKTGQRFRDNYAPFASVDEKTQLRALQRSMIAPQIQSEIWKGLVLKGYTPNELQAEGLVNPDGVQLVGGTTSTQNIRNSQNVNLTTGEMSDSGARPGPRPRFVSEDDLNGTPYKDENASGRRYLGHGISSFSTADWQEDREEKRRREDRLYEATMANAKGKGLSAADRYMLAALSEKGKNERQQKELEARGQRQQAYLDERKSLREQNEMFRIYKTKMDQANKEVDPKKKEQIISEANAVLAKMQYVNNPDAGSQQGGSGTPAPDPNNPGNVIAQGQKRVGGIHKTDTPVKGAKPQTQTATNQKVDNADDYDFGDATADSSTFRYSGDGMGEESISEDDYKKLTDEQRMSGKWQKTYARDGIPIWRRRVYGKRVKSDNAPKQTSAPAAAQTEGKDGNKTPSGTTPKNESDDSADTQRNEPTEEENEKKRNAELGKKSSETVRRVNESRTSNPRTQQKPGSGKSLGRAAHEGVKGSFSQKAGERMYEKGTDDDLRERRVAELQEEARQEKDKWNKKNNGKPFKFSKAYELDELMDTGVSAKSTIDKWAKLRGTQKERDERYNFYGFTDGRHSLKKGELGRKTDSTLDAIQKRIDAEEDERKKAELQHAWDQIYEAFQKPFDFKKK